MPSRRPSAYTKQDPVFDAWYIGLFGTKVTSLAWKNIGDPTPSASKSFASTDCEFLAIVGRVPLLITLSALVFFDSV